MPSTEILFVLYPKVAQLDFAGPYEILSRIPGARVRLASPDGGDLRTELGLIYRDTERLAEVEGCDLLCVPGGIDLSRIMAADSLAEIARLAEAARWVTSVCTGSLVLGAAGLLKGKRSACHWAQRERLYAYGAIPDAARVVRDGRFISGGGVTAGIDFALTCVAEIAGPTVAQAIQLLVEYAPEPPYSAGRPELASAEVRRTCAALLAQAQARGPSPASDPPAH